MTVLCFSGLCDRLEKSYERVRSLACVPISTITALRRTYSSLQGALRGPYNRKTLVSTLVVGVVGTTRCRAPSASEDLVRNLSRYIQIYVLHCTMVWAGCWKFMYFVCYLRISAVVGVEIYNLTAFESTF